MSPTAPIVPEAPYAASHRARVKAGPASSSTALAATSACSNAACVNSPSGKCFSDQSALPTRQLSITAASRRRPRIVSVERPPMSTTSRRSPLGGNRCATPR